MHRIAMRILHITPSFHPAIGGVETHVRRVSECLAAKGHEVTVLTQAGSPAEEALGAVRLRRIPRAGWLSAWRASRPHIAAADIVHCHDAYSFLHFYLPSCWLPPRRPVFVTFHGYEGYPIPREAIRRRSFVRGHVKNALCMGEFICQWYQTQCFAVSYGGADAVRNPPPLPEQPSALFLGRIAEDTSLLLYLDALVALRSDYNRRIHLTVAGDGPLRPIAERYADAQGLSVTFLGAVADPAPLFARASIAFVSGYLTIWQALANRRLVFAIYDNDLKRDYLRGFPEAESVLDIAADPADLAARLHKHLGDPALGEPMRQRGAELAAENTWERVADLYLSMYRAHGYQ
jgi:glycosyltransferase involved in cell wall biosynthesis